MDADLRELERKAKATKDTNDIVAWVVALIRAGRPLPVRLNGWYLGVRIYKSGHDGRWLTSVCEHRHQTKANARACGKRHRYQQRKRDIISILGHESNSVRHGVLSTYLILD